MSPVDDPQYAVNHRQTQVDQGIRTAQHEAVYNLLNQIASGRFIMIGNGGNEKSMAYVGNVAAFIFSLFGNLRQGFTIFNYTDLPNITTKELICIVREELNIKTPPVKIPYFLCLFAGYFFDIASMIVRKKFNVSSVRIRKFCATTRFNAEKAHKTGFNAPYPLKKALQDTILFEFSQRVPKNQ